MGGKMMKTLGILFLVLLFAAGKVSCAEEAAGFAFGPFSLGGAFNLEEAKKHFGEVRAVRESYALETSEGVAWSSVPWRKKAVAADITRSDEIVFEKITFIVVENTVVRMEDIADEAFKTDRDVRVGDSMEKVAEAYGDFSLEKKEAEKDGRRFELLMAEKGSLKIYFLGTDGRLTYFVAHRPFDGKITALPEKPGTDGALAASVKKAADEYRKSGKTAAPVSVETELVCGPFSCGKKFELQRAQELFGEICSGTKYVRQDDDTLEMIPFRQKPDMKFEGNYDIRFDGVAFRVRNEIIESMESQEENGETARGLRVGDGLEKVLELYGLPQYFNSHDKSMVYEKAADENSLDGRFKVFLDDDGRVGSFEAERNAGMQV